MGLGFSVARLLAEKGFQVIITARDLQKASALADKLQADKRDVHALALDITDQDSIEQVAAYIAKKHGRLDVLINNAVAGLNFVQKTEEVDIAEVRLAFETNVIGPWQTTETLLPLLRKSKQARIVNVSSEASSFAAEGGLHGPYTLGVLSAYSVSKAGLNAFTVKLAQSLQDEGILVNAIDPGFTATHPEMVDQYGARSPQESAEGIVWAATLPQDGPTGGFFRDGEPLPW